jgi:hypothetical protein
MARKIEKKEEAKRGDISKQASNGDPGRHRKPASAT